VYSHFVVLAVIVAAPGPKGETPNPASLDGEWVMTQYVRGGNAQGGAKGQEVRIGDGKLVLAGGKEEFSFKTDKKADPAQIDLTSARNKTEVIKGIYKFDKGELILCFPKGGQGDRPTKFESPAGTDVILLTLERSKKKE
jgi:uncharacterized protein (TIGR03067 family)